MSETTNFARARGRRVAVELLDLVSDPDVAVSSYSNAIYRGSDASKRALDVVQPGRRQRLVVLEALDRIGADREALIGFSEILTVYLADSCQCDPGSADAYRSLIATGVEVIT